MSSDPKETSQALLESLKGHYRNSGWFGRARDRWLNRQSQTEMTLVKVLAALREELAEQADARRELEQRTAALLQEERARTEAMSEAAAQEGEQFRLLISALQAGIRAAHEDVERESALRLAERDEDRAHLARFIRLAQETQGNLQATERILRTLDERLQGLDSVASEIRDQAAQRLKQGLARASEQLLDLEQRWQERSHLAEAAIAAGRAASAEAIAGVEKTIAAGQTESARAIARVEKTIASSRTESAEAIAGVQKTIAAGRAESTEAIAGVKKSIAAAKTESAEAIARVDSELKRALAATEQGVRELQKDHASHVAGLAKTGADLDQLRVRLDGESSSLASRIAEVHRGTPYFESAEAAVRFDDFYFAFERRYRGSREEIARRQRIYLPFLHESEALARGSKDTTRIVDLGCGRGEWLELLRTEGFLAAVGVDQSDRMIQICRTEDLTIVNAEALHYLRGLPDESVGVVSAFHVVEHIPFSDLLEILIEARRVLMPGGLLLLETPNAENVLVSAVNFRHDPTHRFMIPPLLLMFAVEHAGFAAPTPLRLHPYGPEYQVEMTTSVGRRFNDFFFGAQDFGLVAAKP